MSEEVNFSGPIFNGQAAEAAKAFTEEATHAISRVTLNTVRVNLNSSIRVNTGHYVSQVHTDRAGVGDRVNDGRMIYGPWLEGTGSRNRSTRFKGYWSFRRAAQEINGRADAIAEAVLPPSLSRMQ